MRHSQAQLPFLWVCMAQQGRARLSCMKPPAVYLVNLVNHS